MAEKAPGYSCSGIAKRCRKLRKGAGLLSPVPKKLKRAFSEGVWTIDDFLITAEFASRNQYRHTKEEPRGASLSPSGACRHFSPHKNLHLGPPNKALGTFSVTLAPLRGPRYKVWTVWGQQWSRAARQRK